MKIPQNIFVYIVLTAAFTTFTLSFLPFVGSIITGAIFALGISYWIDNVYIKFKRKKKILVVSALAGALLIVLGTAFSATVRIYNVTLGEQREETLESLKAGKTSLFAGIDTARQKLNGYGLRIPPITEDNILKDASKAFQSSLMKTTSQLGTFFDAFTDFLLGSMVLFIFMMIMILSRANIEKAVANKKFLGGPKVQNLYHKAQFSSYASVMTIFSVGFIQTIVMTLGARFAGFNESAIIFIITLVFSFFPVLGTAPVGLALAAVGFLQGDSSAGTTMLGISIFVGVVDNWLKPFIVSSQGPQVNPLIALVGIIGAVIVFGVPGLFIGPFLMIFVPNLKKEIADLIERQPEPPPTVSLLTKPLELRPSKEGIIKI